MNFIHLFCVVLPLSLAVNSNGKIKVDKETGNIIVVTPDGQSHELKKAAGRHLGEKIVEDGPDTVRANARDGADIVGFRFIRGDDGKIDMDGDGITHVGEKIYEFTQVGDITETESDILIDVDMTKTKIFANSKAAMNDEKVIPQLIRQKLDQERKQKPKELSLIRNRRQTNQKLIVELAIFVDQGFWDKYVSEKGADKAEEAVESFIEIMLDTMQSHYKELGIVLNVNEFEIWKRQPRVSSSAFFTGDINIYLGHLPGSGYTPDFKYVDHTMVISGYQLLKNDKPIVAASYSASLCEFPSYAVSIMNTFSPTIGETAAHELAHSFGVKHDGVESSCSPSGSLMAENYNVDGIPNKSWSSCSKKKFEQRINKWNDEGTNCLLNKPRKTWDRVAEKTTTKEIEETTTNEYEYEETTTNEYEYEETTTGYDPYCVDHYGRSACENYRDTISCEGIEAFCKKTCGSC